GRDHAGENVLVRPALATAVVLGFALLDADLADEGLTLEVLVLDRAGGLRLWAHVVGLEPERRVKDGLDPAVAEIDGLGLSVVGSDDDEGLGELRGLIEPVDNGELGVEHLAATVFAAFEQAAFAGAAGAKVHADGCDRPVGSTGSSRPERSLAGNPQTFGVVHTNARAGGLPSPKLIQFIVTISSTIAGSSRPALLPSICGCQV